MRKNLYGSSTTLMMLRGCLKPSVGSVTDRFLCLVELNVEDYPVLHPERFSIIQQSRVPTDVLLDSAKYLPRGYCSKESVTVYELCQHLLRA
jgi:hypothetical protein